GRGLEGREARESPPPPAQAPASAAPPSASEKQSRERTTRRRRWQRAVHAQQAGSRSVLRSRAEARTLQFASPVLVSLPPQTSGGPKSCCVYRSVTRKRVRCSVCSFYLEQRGAAPNKNCKLNT